MFKSTHPAIAELHYKIACIRKIQGIRHITFEAFKTALYHQLHSTAIDYSQLADIYDNLAGITANQEEIEESSHYSQESLQIRLKHNPSDAFLSYINMGRLKIYEKQYLEAQELFQKAIDVFVPDNTFASSYNLGRIYVDLALTYNSLKKYGEAMKTISEANKAKQLDDPKTDSLIAYATAYIYQTQNHYEEALQYYEKILFEFYPAVDDDTLAITYMRMSGIYYKQKQFKLAIGYCEKCLNMKPKNITLDVVYENMARIYISFGQEDEGAKQEYYAKALDNLTKMLELCSCDNKKSGEIHSTIAKLRRQLNDIDLAIKHYELSRDHLLNMSPKNSNHLLAVYEALVDGYTCCQNKQKVIENYELVLNIYLNDDCPQATKDLKKAAILSHEIGVLYYESKNIEKAIEYTEQGLQLELDAIVPTSELEDQAMHSLACSYINLSTFYKESDDTGKQIVNLKKSLDIYRKFTSASSSTEVLYIMAQIYKGLGNCYEKINDPVLALKYHQRAFNCLERSGIADETKLTEYRQCLEKLEKLGMNTDK